MGDAQHRHDRRLNGERFTEVAYEETMGPMFVDAVPFEVIAADVPDLVGQGPWTLVGTLGTSTTGGAWEVAPAGGDGTWSIELEVDPGSGLVVALQLSPMREFVEPAGVEEATTRLDALGTTRFMVADVSDGTCRSLVGLSMNPGAPDTTGQWTEILFKGGSEPGVLALVWRVTDADGRAFVVAGGVTNPAAPIDDFEAASLLAYRRDHAADSDANPSPATSTP